MTARNLLYVLLVVLALLAAPALAQTPPHCDLSEGCHWELTIGTQGSYSEFVFHLGPDAQNLSPFAFPIIEPRTQVAESEVGIARIVSGLVVHHQTTIELRDDSGNLLQTQELKSASGGQPVEQAFLYNVCATSPTEPDICLNDLALTAR